MEAGTRRCADLTVYFDGCPDDDLKGCRWNAIMSEKLDGQRVRIVPDAPTPPAPGHGREGGNG